MAFIEMDFASGGGGTLSWDGYLFKSGEGLCTDYLQSFTVTKNGSTGYDYGTISDVTIHLGANAGYTTSITSNTFQGKAFSGKSKMYFIGNYKGGANDSRGILTGQIFVNGTSVISKVLEITGATWVDYSLDIDIPSSIADTDSVSVTLDFYSKKPGNTSEMNCTNIHLE